MLCVAKAVLSGDCRVGERDDHQSIARPAHRFREWRDPLSRLVPPELRKPSTTIRDFELPPDGLAWSEGHRRSDRVVRTEDGAPANDMHQGNMAEQHHGER